MLSGPPLFFLLTLDVVSSPNIQLTLARRFFPFSFPSLPFCVCCILPGGVELRPSFSFFTHYPSPLFFVLLFLLFIPTIQLYTHTRICNAR